MFAKQNLWTGLLLAYAKNKMMTFYSTSANLYLLVHKNLQFINRELHLLTYHNSISTPGCSPKSVLAPTAATSSSFTDALNSASRTQFLLFPVNRSSSAFPTFVNGDSILLGARLKISESYLTSPFLQHPHPIRNFTVVSRETHQDPATPPHDHCTHPGAGCPPARVSPHLPTGLLASARVPVQLPDTEARLSLLNVHLVAFCLCSKLCQSKSQNSYNGP